MNRTTLASNLALVALLCCGFLPRCTGTDDCGNSVEVWVHRVVAEAEECSDCLTLAFNTPIVEQNSFGVRREPDHVVGRCEIQNVEVRSDGVALMLTRKGYEPIARLRESLTGRGTRSGQLAVLRLEGSEAPFAVLQVEDLRRRLPLFDFASEEQIERFVSDLGVGETAVSQAATPSIDAPGESEAALEAKELLRQLEKEDPILDRLREAVESGEGDEVVQEILDELEQPRTGS